MATSANEILVEFTAKTDGLVKGADAAQAKIGSVVESTTAVTKATQSMSQTAQRSFQATGAAVRTMIPFLDTATQRIVMFAAEGIERVKVLTEWLGTLGLAFKISLVGAILLGVAALVAYIARTNEATESVKRQEEALKAQAEAMKSIKSTVDSMTQSWDGYMESLDKSRLAQEKFGRAVPWEQLITQGQDLIITLQLQRDKLWDQLKAVSSASDEWWKYSDALGTTEEKIRVLNLVLEKLKKNQAASPQAATGGKTQGVSDDKVMARRIEQEIKLADEIKRRSDISVIAHQQDVSAAEQFLQWSASLQISLADLYTGIQSIATNISSGLGKAFADAIVYGKSWSESMMAFVKSVAAAFIQFLVELVAQQLLFWGLSAVGAITAASLTIALETAKGAAAAASSVFQTMPWFVALALAPAIAQAATGIITGAAAAGGAAGKAAGMGIGALSSFAQGGVVMRPMLAMIGDAPGGEMVLPRSDYERMIAGAGGDINVNLIADGRKLASVSVPHLPREVRRRGVKGL